MIQTATKVRPIILDAESVRAIIDGRKTMTRRVMTPQPEDLYEIVNNGEVKYRRPAGHPMLDEARGTPGYSVRHASEGARCPYGQPGDRLWVREAFWQSSRYPGTMPCGEPTPQRMNWGAQIHFAADGTPADTPNRTYPGDQWRSTTMPRAPDPDAVWKLRPSIHLPRRRSRLTLEVVSVRVERLQEISEADAKAEGMDRAACVRSFRAAKGWQEPVEECWLEDDGGTLDGSYCQECAERLAKKRRVEVRGNGYMAGESDGPAFCDECYRPLLMSLTEYGIDRELYLESGEDERKHYPAAGLDASIAHMIADGIGDLRKRQEGRLAQIGFATRWNAINAKRGFGWESNPWVWAVEFRRVEEGQPCE